MPISPSKKLFKYFTLSVLFFVLGLMSDLLLFRKTIDCNTIATDYLTYAQKKYNSTGLDKTWDQIVTIETAIHNVCSTSPNTFQK